MVIYNLDYVQCPINKEWGYKLSSAPKEWYVCDFPECLTHDLIDHNPRKLNTNTVLDEFKALGIAAKSRGEDIDEEINVLFREIFKDIKTPIDPVYLENHHKNYTYEWLEYIAHEENLPLNWDEEPYPKTYSREDIEKVIKTAGYYFNLGVLSVTNQSVMYPKVLKEVTKLYHHPLRFTKKARVQIINSKHLVRVYLGNQVL
jgi:hypothetical protein